MSEYDIGHIRDQLVNIQIGLTRTLSLIDDLQRADGCAEEMEDDLPDEDEGDE